MTRSDPYSTSRIASGVAYLVGGKLVSAFANISTFMLLVRGLPVEAFAAYTVLFAIAELADAVTGVGLSHVLSRYVPELHVQHRRRTLRLLLLYGLAARVLVAAAFLGVAYLLVPAIAPAIGLEQWQWAVKAYLLVVLVRITSLALFGILEAMLHQKISQVGASLVAVAKFGLLAAASAGGLDLRTVIGIELATDALGVLIALMGILRVTRREPAGSETDEGAGWLRGNLRRMTAFGLKGYLQHLLILPYNGSTARLLVGGSLSAPEVALFGFAQSAAELMGRYLPVNLLSGVIRPVLTARYVRDQRFPDLVFAANMIVKISGALAAFVAVVTYSGGEALLGLVTKGKYGEGVVGLLLLMCALVFAYALRVSLDQVCHAVERNGPLIWSNILINLSVVPGVLLLPVLGVYAMPLSSMTGVFAGCLILVWRLRRGGFDYRHDVSGLLRLLAAMGVAMLAADAARWAEAGWAVSLAVGATSYALALLAFRPASADERALVLALVRRR